MEFKGIFTLASLPLQKLAEISIAQYFWNRHDIVRRMNADYAESVNKRRDVVFEQNSEFCMTLDPDGLYILMGRDEVINYIMEQVDLLPIPRKLALEIQIVASKIWQKACYWRHFVIQDLKLNQKYAEKIYWTSHGEINQGKIVHDFWLKDKELPPSEHQDFSFLCGGFPSMNDLEILITNQEMLLDSGWSLKGYCVLAVHVENHVKDLLFLINKMNELQKLDFFSRNFYTTFQALCVIWPYQELCSQFLYTFWCHNQSNEEQFLRSVIISCANKERILERVTARQFCDESDCKALHLAYHYPMINYAREKFFNHLLAIIMDLLSKETKENVFTGYDFEIVRELVKIKYYISLRIIINDIHLVKYKLPIIHIGANDLIRVIRNRDYNSFYKFFEVLELEPGSLKWFRFNMESHCLKAFLMGGDFKEADKYLNWFTDVDAERKKLLDQIDAAEITQILMAEGNKFEQAEEFLTWRFETDEERMRIKISLQSEEVIEEQICYFFYHSDYLKSESQMQELCRKSLNFFFGSDVEVNNFDKNKLKPWCEKLLVKYWNGLSDKYNMDFDKLLRFIFLSNEEIEEIKTKLANDMTLWIDTYALDKNNFEVVEDLFEWVYGTNTGEMIKVIHNYMMSPKGILLIIKLFENASRESFFKTRAFEEEEFRIRRFSRFWLTRELLNNSPIQRNLTQMGKTVKGIKFDGIMRVLDEIKKDELRFPFLERCFGEKYHSEKDPDSS